MNKIIIIKTRSYGRINVPDFKASDVIVLDKGGYLDRWSAYSTKLALQARGMVGDREYILRYESAEEAIQKLEGLLLVFRYSYGRTDGYAAIQSAIAQLDQYTTAACGRIVTVASAPVREVRYVRESNPIVDGIEALLSCFSDEYQRSTSEVVFR